MLSAGGDLYLGYRQRTPLAQVEGAIEGLRTSIAVDSGKLPCNALKSAEAMQVTFEHP